MTRKPQNRNYKFKYFMVLKNAKLTYCHGPDQILRLELPTKT